MACCLPFCYSERLVLSVQRCQPTASSQGMWFCEFVIAFRATMSTHDIVAGEEFPHHVGRDDSARRGGDCNGCYLHDALRAQELLYGLKESCVDKKNKVNSFGIIKLLYRTAVRRNSFRLASRATSLRLREARRYCKFLT